MIHSTSRESETTDTKRDAPLELAALYLLLLCPTLCFKRLYLAEIESWDAPLPMLGPPRGAVSQAWFYLTHLLPADFLDTLVLTLVVYGVLRLIVRMRFRAMAVTASAIAVAIGGASALSLHVLGGFLSPQTLSAGWDWTRHQPEILRRVLTPTRLLVLGAGVLWIFLPALSVAASMGRTVKTSPLLRRAVLVGTAAAAILALSIGIPRAAAGAGGASAVEGFWTAVARGALASQETDLTRVAATSEESVLNEYRQLAYPSGYPTAAKPLVDPYTIRQRPHHVLIVSLETAPLEFYGIADDPSFATFHEMSRHSLVAERHYATAPTTRLAVDSLISGTYSRPGKPLVTYGDFRSDSLAEVLRSTGYETSYLDAYDLGWNTPDETRAVRALGFDAIDDMETAKIPAQTNVYDQNARQEQRLFEIAVDRIAGAATRHRRALVCLATHIGHYAWAPPPDQPSLSARERVAHIGHFLDQLMGQFLAALHEKGLDDEVMVVVTGDHGLRFRMEFEDLGERPQYGDATFRVPLLIYAPDVFPAQVRVPWVTSHVDVAPTLLDLMGIRREQRLYHGENMLDGRLVDRATFLLSGFYPGNHPLDAFIWRNRVYTQYELTGLTTVRDAAGGEDRLLDETTGAGLGPDEVHAMFARARAILDRTAASFLRRKSPKG